jgi:membrane associated rhomboid family serine protease
VIDYLGACYLPALHAGLLWRHATAVFLHIGLVHLAFNMIA